MTILIWNSRGLGRPATVQELERLVHTHKPKNLFISETRQNKEYVEGLRWRLGLKHVITFKDEGKGGGLALFWHESVHVDLFKMGARLFDVTIHNLSAGNKWRCTFVYGEPRTHERHNMWNLLTRIKPLLPGPWCMLGDFNECLWQEEHFSAHRRSEKQMADFREALSQCDLYDLGFVGKPWTFDNQQEGNKNVRVRLDRVVADYNWTNMFPNYQVRHLTSSRSDHCPILLTLDSHGTVNTLPRVRRYECYWEREAALEEEIANAWSLHKKPSDLGDVASNLMGVMDSLHAWSSRTIGNISKQINRKRKKLENLETRSDANSRKAARKIRKELDELLLKEETRWRQRSRISWLREGDRNTNYFHRRASWRQKKNKIEKLQSENGDIIEDAALLESMTTDFFTELYKADPTVQPGIIT
jgi:hypothetical protein